MLLERLKNETDFTRCEKNVSRYIVKNIEKIANMDSKELAKATYTSKSTVVRLSQKLGLAGYRDFKLKLVAEINQINRVNQLLSEEPITNESSCSDIIQTLPVLYDKAITNTRLSLNKNSIQRIQCVLQQAECIDIYGTGISYTLAQSAAFKISTLGMDSSAYESINGHALASKNNKKTICILISFTGANRTVQQMCQYLKQATNSCIIGIVGPHSEGMEQWCDEIIEIPNKDSLLSLDVISSFMAANYVLDIIFSMILAQNYENHVESSLEMLKHVSVLLNKDYGYIL